MTIIEEIIDTFKDVALGTEYSYEEIVQKVHTKFGRNPRSIIPSDYCYNRLNYGIDYEKSVHLFEYTDERKYRYLGPGIKYNGSIFHKPKGQRETCIGYVNNGVLFLNEAETVVPTENM